MMLLYLKISLIFCALYILWGINWRANSIDSSDGE
jgi:hypothetical protein